MLLVSPVKVIYKQSIKMHMREINTEEGSKIKKAGGNIQWGNIKGIINVKLCLVPDSLG